MTTRVLVTGATGLIGRHVVDVCVRLGLAVIPVSRRPVSRPKGAGTVGLDLLRSDSTGAIQSLNPTVIIHAAAVLPGQFHDASADDAARANRVIDDVVFQAAAAIGCSLIFLSGASLYGCVDTVANEGSPIQPRGPYLAEKQRSEEKLQTLVRRSVVLRVSAAYGPQQKSATVLQNFVRRALRGEDLFFFGTGSREQDFVSAQDVASAAVAAMESSAEGTFNIASGRPIVMKALADLVVASLGSASRVRAAGVEDPQERCVARYSIDKASRELRWAPAVTLEAGILQLAAALRASPPPLNERA